MMRLSATFRSNDCHAPTPLRVLITWHWGSAELGLMEDRTRLMDQENVVSLGGGIVTLDPGPLSIPLRQAEWNYGGVTLQIADTSRLMDPDNAKNLDRLGHELKM